MRGQGGQNALGPERGDALGYLRTEELIAAMALIRADLAWLAETDDDPIRDFGFSKSDEQTFGYWGEEHSLRQMIKIVRMFKPDILLPTFLDVPGQHGHHRAVTQVTLSAFDLAADDSVYPDLNLGSWQTNALYLPAWGGGGGSYDDEVPPPNATHQVDTGEFDAVYGGTYAQIGEWSRASHATQGMGRLLDEENWPVQLHQLKTASNTPFADKLTENLPPEPTKNDPIGHSENLTIITQSIHSCDGLEAEIFCYACVETYPLQSEITIQMDSSGAKIEVIIDISTPSDKILKFSRIH